jgi:hypothetical protein
MLEGIPTTFDKNAHELTNCVIYRIIIEQKG